jgi:hypothetical protein
MEGIRGQASWAVSTASGSKISVEVSERGACAVLDNRTRERQRTFRGPRHPSCRCELVGVGFVFRSEEVEEWPDLLVGLGVMSHRCVSVDHVVVSSSDSAPFDDVGLDEVCDDSLGRSLGDSDRLGDVSEPDVWVLRDAQEHLCVVREECPGRGVLVT